MDLRTLSTRLTIEFEWISQTRHGSMQCEVPNIFSGYVVAQGIFATRGMDCQVSIKFLERGAVYTVLDAEHAKQLLVSEFVDNGKTLGESW